jgi:hypothetical protein
MSGTVGSTTLIQIRDKIRKVTGSPSQYQITDDEIDDYINTFYLYDFPEHLRLLQLKQTYEFFTQPNVESYKIPTESIISVEPPIYVGGYQARYLQDRQTFFMRWPPLNQYQQIGTGNGTTSNPPLQQIVSVPIIQNTLYISCYYNGNTITYNDNGNGSFNSETFNITNINNANPVLVTCPGHPFVAGDNILISDVIGMLDINQVTATVVSVVPNVSFTLMIDATNFAAYTGGGFAQNINVGSINYTTGAISMNWGIVPDADSIIQAQYIYYSTGRPYDVLMYDYKFHFRPVPDKPYKVVINCFVQPTSLFMDNSTFSNAATNAPLQREWWQMIAYGASLKIFADRGDMENLANFTPLFEEQKLLGQRRTLKQITNQRTNTIYESQNLFPLSNFYPYN